MKVRYKKQNYYLKADQTVLVDWTTADFTHVWKTATIVDILSSQFTVLIDVDGQPLSYLFYHDVGDTWRPNDG